MLMLMLAAVTQGYLAKPVDWRHVLEPPPAAGSDVAKADRAAYLAAAGQRDSQAFRDATTQAEPSPAAIAHFFGCAIGHRISSATTPRTMTLLRRLTVDMRLPVEQAKDKFKRPRPYEGDPAARPCDPRAEPRATPGLSYSYPSGHATFGELWGRALSAADPTDAGRLVAVGHSIGDNRVICRVHFPSDIAAGRKLGDAIYDAAAATPEFQADLAAAKAEVVAAPAAEGCDAAPAP